MTLNFAYSRDLKDAKRCYIAVVVLDNRGTVAYKETNEYTASDVGKYWLALRALKRVLTVINKLVAEQKLVRDELVRVVLPSTVIMGWFEKGRAVEPYRYAFEMLLADFSECPCEIELVPQGKCFNRAKKYASPDYVEVEKYQSVLDVYAE